MTRHTDPSMLVLGLMSGTSVDGIDVALARIAGRPPRVRARLENYCTVPFPPAVRAEILRLADGGGTSTAQVSQLNFLVGELFARAALAACRRFRVRPQRIALLGSHGQTVYHQGNPGPIPAITDSSRKVSAVHERARRLPHVASTLQIGEPAVIAERTGIPTVADFRPADIAAGGQGAPLVPFVDYLLYRHSRCGRVALNIGGIANVTVIPRAARPEQVFAFDTGPGNMVMDALTRRFTRGRQPFDRDAKLARSGTLLPGLLAELLADPYFRKPPPKTAGREQFGEAYAQRLLDWGHKYRARAEDLLRTATLLTPLSILDAFHRWILPRTHVQQLIVSGGGAHNPLVMAQLEAGLLAFEQHGKAKALGISVLTSSDLGVPEDAKEAFAFAILAYHTCHGWPATLPGATGARHASILGKVAHVHRG